MHNCLTQLFRFIVTMYVCTPVTRLQHFFFTIKPISLKAFFNLNICCLVSRPCKSFLKSLSIWYGWNLLFKLGLILYKLIWITIIIIITVLTLLHPDYIKFIHVLYVLFVCLFGRYLMRELIWHKWIFNKAFKDGIFAFLGGGGENLVCDKSISCLLTKAFF